MHHASFIKILWPLFVSCAVFFLLFFLPSCVLFCLYLPFYLSLPDCVNKTLILWQKKKIERRHSYTTMSPKCVRRLLVHLEHSHHTSWLSHIYILYSIWFGLIKQLLLRWTLCLHSPTPYRGGGGLVPLAGLVGTSPRPRHSVLQQRARSKAWDPGKRRLEHVLIVLTPPSAAGRRPRARNGAAGSRSGPSVLLFGSKRRREGVETAFFPV